MKLKHIPYNKTLDNLAVALKLQLAGEPIRARAFLLKAAKGADAQQALAIINENNQYAFTASASSIKPQPKTASGILANIKQKQKLKADTLHNEEPSMGEESEVDLTNASEVPPVVAEEEMVEVDVNDLEAIDDMIAQELEELAAEEEIPATEVDNIPANVAAKKKK